MRDALATQSSALAAQQQQIQELKQELERKDQVWQQAQQQLQQTQATAADAQNKAAAVETVANDEKASVAKLAGDVADVKTNLTTGATSVQEERKRVSALEEVVGRFRFGGDVRVRGDNQTHKRFHRGSLILLEFLVLIDYSVRQSRRFERVQRL